jgi:hypothetical protein
VATRHFDFKVEPMAREKYTAILFGLPSLLMSWLWVGPMGTLSQLAWFCSIVAVILCVNQLRRPGRSHRRLLLAAIWVQVIFQAWDLYLAYLFPPSSLVGSGSPPDEVRWAYVRLTVLVYSFGSFLVGLFVDWRENRPCKRHLA